MGARVARSATAFLKGEEGPTAVEYAVMLALIIIVCIVAVTALGQNASSTFANASLNASAKPLAS